MISNFLQRLKSYLSTIKEILLYVVTPVGFIAGYIWYLIKKNEVLEEQINVLKENSKLNELHQEQVSIDDTANVSDLTFEELRSRYYAQGSNRSRGESNTVTKETDRSKGSGNQSSSGDAKK